MGYLETYKEQGVLDQVFQVLDYYLNRDIAEVETIRTILLSKMDEYGVENVEFYRTVADYHTKFALKSGFLAALKAVMMKIVPINAPETSTVVSDNTEQPPTPPVAPNLGINIPGKKLIRPRKHTPGRLYGGFSKLTEAIIARLLITPEPISAVDLAKELQAEDRIHHVWAFVKKLRSIPGRYRVVEQRDELDRRKIKVKLIDTQLPIPGTEQ